MISEHSVHLDRSTHVQLQQQLDAQAEDSARYKKLVESREAEYRMLEDEVHRLQALQQTHRKESVTVTTAELSLLKQETLKCVHIALLHVLVLYLTIRVFLD